MAYKFIILAALATIGHCGNLGAVPLAQPSSDYSSFSYDVADPNTGDYKSQVETRSNGAVQGQYSLVDADGTRRVVDYTADDVNGFNAVVRKEVAGPVVAAVDPVVEARVAPVHQAPLVRSYATVNPQVPLVRSVPQFVNSPAPVVRSFSGAYAPNVPLVRAVSPVARSVSPVFRSVAPAHLVNAPVPLSRSFAPAPYASVYSAYPQVQSAYAPQVYSGPTVYSAGPAPAPYW